MGTCGKCGEQLVGARCWSCVTTMLGRDGTVVTVPQAPTPQITPGTVLEEKWRVERLVGQGGMGLVYEAFDLALERPVAVKLMAENLLTNDEALSLFEREAKLTARLTHPNIVAVHAVGRHLRRPFIVMEFLEGQSLAQTMNASGGRLGLRQTVDVTRQVCAGLQFVHERGCIHRDVKPTNIFVSRDGHATLLDFGILVDLGSGSAFAGASLMGTPGYIAPEVVQRVTADARSDVYAMGAVIYRVLAGASPWTSNTHKLTLDDLLLPPKSLAEVSPNLPKEVCWVVMKSLSREPGLRYATAKALSDALESAASGTAVEPSLSSSGSPLEAPPHTQRLGETRRKRMPAALMAGVIAVFAAIGIVTWSLDRNSATKASSEEVFKTPAALTDSPALSARPEPAPIQVALLPVELSPPAVKPEPRRRAQPEKQGQLRVVSQEKGQATWALVEVDGQPRGGTPLDLELRAGAHRLIVTREGFKRVEKSVTVKPGERSLERIELMPLRP